MKIELSVKEVEMIDTALKAWERAPHSEGMTCTLLTTMLTPKEDREKVTDHVKEEMAKAGAEARRREAASLLLRAKLAQACAAQSEHDIEASVQKEGV